MSEEQQDQAQDETLINPAPPAPPAHELAPGDTVTLAVFNHASAGKNVNTRWGHVEFDKDGMGEISLKVQDITLLDQLQWLLPEDRAKYLGVAVRATAEVKADNVAEENNAKMAALIADNVKLTTENEKGRSQLDALLTRIDVLEEAEKGVDAKIEVLTKENASLKTSLAKAKKEAKKAAKA
jgi:hypothetical protein